MRSSSHPSHRVSWAASAALLCLVALFPGCDCGTGPDGDDDEPVIADDVFVAESGGSVSLVGIEGDVFTLGYEGAVPDIGAGTIIVISDSTGYLRRVVSVTQTVVGSESRLVLETEFASLSEVILEGELDATIPLDLGKMRPKPGSQLQIDSDRERYWIDLSGTIYEGDVGPAHVLVSMREESELSTSLELRVRPVFDYGIREFRASVFGGVDMDVIVDAEVDAELVDCHRDTILPGFQSGPILIGHIGPVPIFVTYELDFEVGFDADMDCEAWATAGCIGDYSIEVGAKYVRGSGWSSIWERGGDFSLHEADWSAGCECSVRAYVRPVFKVMIYDFAGSYIAAEPYAKFNGTLDARTELCWELYGGIEADLGLRVEIWDWQLADYSVTLAAWESEIASDCWEDTTPPSTVSDLACTEPTSSSIRLTWTAPGDDGDLGQARQYDVRYAETSIDDAPSWDCAYSCNGEPTPLPAGSSETFVVSGLSPGTGYYFAIRTIDEAVNWSDLSNSPSCGTLGEELSGCACVTSHVSRTLHVFDISDPTSLACLGSCPTAGYACGVAIEGHYAFVAVNGSGLEVFNISDPVNPSSVGVCSTDGYATQVVISGDYALVSVADAGLQVIDVSEPTNPVSVGVCNTPDYAQDLAVAGGYAYVAHCDPNQPSGGDAGVSVIDITNPSSPILVGSCGTPSYAKHIEVLGNYAYVTGFTMGGSSGLQILDIANPEHPMPVGSWDAAPFWADDVAVSGDYAYVTIKPSGLRVLDVSDPSSPSPVGALHSTPPPIALALGGAYLYLAVNSGLHVVDVCNPACPAFAGGCYVLDEAWGIAVAKDAP